MTSGRKRCNLFLITHHPRHNQILLRMHPSCTEVSPLLTTFFAIRSSRKFSQVLCKHQLLPIPADHFRGPHTVSASQITDVNIIRKLSDYASTVPRLAPILPCQRLAEVPIGLVTRYAEFANKTWVETKQFHNQFPVVISDISDAVDQLDGDLDVLRSEIEELEEDAPLDNQDSNYSRLFRSTTAPNVLMLHVVACESTWLLR